VVDKRLKIQVELALVTESKGEARRLPGRGTESPRAEHGPESLAEGQLMEQVCERENLKRALARVKSNQGSAGVDRMNGWQLTRPLASCCESRSAPRITHHVLHRSRTPTPPCFTYRLTCRIAVYGPVCTVVMEWTPPFETASMCQSGNVDWPLNREERPR
jgi:hypothetical protein